MNLKSGIKLHEEVGSGRLAERGEWMPLRQAQGDRGAGQCLGREFFVEVLEQTFEVAEVVGGINELSALRREFFP